MNLLKRYDEFKSFETVQKFYRDSEPTTKKVLALLKADPKSDSERVFEIFTKIYPWIR